jgi:hypothetical protein
VRVFEQKQFSKWAAGEGIDDSTLIETAKEAFAGDLEADLGGYLFKKRVARRGGGKSGGYRTILCFRKANCDRIFFLHGFPKNRKDNISPKEERALQKVAMSLVQLSDGQIEDLKKMGSIRELKGSNDDAEK